MGECSAGVMMLSPLPLPTFHKEAIKQAPLERILLETDTPVSYQGRESRPKDVQITLQEVVRIKKLNPAIVSEQTTINASQFFQIPFQWKD